MSALATPLLVRLPSWIGDAVAAEPALSALEEHLGEEPGLWSLAAPGRVLELFAERFPRARRLALEVEPPPRPWRGHATALLLAGSFRSAWQALRAGIPRRVGWSRDGRRWLLTESLAPPAERGRVPLGLGRAGTGRRLLPRPFGASALELLGLLGVPVRRAAPRLVPTSAALGRAEERLAALGLLPGSPFVLVNVGGRPGSAKALPGDLWPPWIAALAAGLAPPLVVTHGPGEARALALPDGVRTLGQPPALDELVALASLAALLVTADQGPRHLARATGTPVLVLFGPTDPRHTAGPGPPLRGLAATVPCGPCHLERCPLGGAEERRCFRALDPATGVVAARELLEGRRGPPVVRTTPGFR